MIFTLFFALQPLPGLTVLPRLFQLRGSFSWKSTIRLAHFLPALTVAVSFVFLPFFTFSGAAPRRTFSRWLLVVPGRPGPPGAGLPGSPRR